MDVSQMKPGSFYRFSHSGKGEFVAIFRGIERQADDEDFVSVDIWTGPGSSQERFANSFVHLGGGRKTTPLLSGKLLRPSKITDINAPTNEEQKRLRESIESSAERDYQDSVSEYRPPRRVIAPPAPVEPEPMASRISSRVIAIVGAGIGLAIVLAAKLLGGF